jgi:hypothetical protein
VAVPEAAPAEGVAVAIAAEVVAVAGVAERAVVAAVVGGVCCAQAGVDEAGPAPIRATIATRIAAAVRLRAPHRVTKRGWRLCRLIV